MPAVLTSMEVEKEELNWLLTSGVLGRSNHLARMLTFICEKHFKDQDDQVKEYTIAVEALGRRSDFDPQTDTIVRVTAHSLRKRLQEIYQNGGADRPVHILIPPGHYVPSFIHKAANFKPDGHDVATAITPYPAQIELRSEPPAIGPSRGRKYWGIVVAAFVLVFGAAIGLFLFARQSAPKTADALAAASPAPLPVPKNTIRALMGKARKTYVDRSGNTWATGKYCTGDNITVPNQRIDGTEDPYLYLSGIRGMAHCVFPVKPGMYELHFHFAETSDLQAATRRAVLSINAGADVIVDVVDNAGGDGIATSYVVSGIHPENDGAIHIDYTSEVSLLNAVEILPSPSEALLPIRITASPTAILDSSNQLWLSDRYFSGGRPGRLPHLVKELRQGIYGSDRVGRFRYTLPVLPNKKYRLSLFFSEPWFGQHNGSTGGVGSRIFDVSCNGSLLMKNFDIMAEGGSNPVVKTFDNVEATPQGKIELYFMPVVNYPLLNAIEVVPEP
jgi:hypothetical protein